MSEDLLKQLFASVVARVQASGEEVDGDEEVELEEVEFPKLPHMFACTVQKMLQEFNRMFPEEELIATWLSEHERDVLGNRAQEAWLVKQWNYDLSHDSLGERFAVELDTLIRERQYDALLASGSWVVSAVPARAMWYDTDLDDTDRDTLCQYFDKLNTYARLYGSIPHDMHVAMEHVIAEVDLTEEITQATMTRLLLKMLTGRHCSMKRLMSWATHLVPIYTSGAGLEMVKAALTSPIVQHATGGMDLPQLMTTVQSGLAGGLAGAMEGSSSGAAMADPASLLQCMLGMGGGAGSGLS
jgi:hypothetical protein